MLNGGILADWYQVVLSQSLMFDWIIRFTRLHRTSPTTTNKACFLKPRRALTIFLVIDAYWSHIWILQLRSNYVVTMYCTKPCTTAALCPDPRAAWTLTALPSPLAPAAPRRLWTLWQSNGDQRGPLWVSNGGHLCFKAVGFWFTDMDRRW